LRRTASALFAPHLAVIQPVFVDSYAGEKVAKAALIAVRPT
jgi:hypothetical protein